MAWLPQRICVVPLLPASSAPNWGQAALQLNQKHITEQLQASERGA